MADYGSLWRRGRRVSADGEERHSSQTRENGRRENKKRARGDLSEEDRKTEKGYVQSLHAAQCSSTPIGEGNGRRVSFVGRGASPTSLLPRLPGNFEHSSPRSSASVCERHSYSRQALPLSLKILLLMLSTQAHGMRTGRNFKQTSTSERSTTSLEAARVHEIRRVKQRQ